MRELLTEEEKRYATSKFIDPMVSDMNKVPLFQTIERAKIMLETSLRRLLDDKNYEGRISFRDNTRNNKKQIIVLLEIKKKDCLEVLSYALPINLN